MLQQDQLKPNQALAFWSCCRFVTCRGKRRPKRPCRLGAALAPISLVVTTLVFMLTCGVPSVEASKDKAAEHVRQGIRHFRAGEMQAAQRAFAEADVASPDNPRIGFDRACVLSATGDADRATELLRESAMSREPDLVAQSRYNLGSIQAAKGKSIV